MLRCQICGAEHISCGQKTPMPIPPIDFSWEPVVPHRPNYIATERLYLNAEGEVVRGRDPSRAFLLVPVGGVLSYDEAVRYGLVGEGLFAPKQSPLAVAGQERPAPVSPEPDKPAPSINIAVSDAAESSSEPVAEMQSTANEAFAQLVAPVEAEPDDATETTGVGVSITQPKKRGRPPIMMPNIRVKE